MEIAMVTCRQVMYDYGHCNTLGYTMLPKCETEVNEALARGMNQDPLSPQLSKTSSYCNKIETKHLYYLPELYRYNIKTQEE
jgi:hypothetical protein